MKQTAVEWLLEQIRLNKLTFYNEKDNKIPITLVDNDIVQQAKEMEQQQIIDAYTHDRTLLQITAEHYYNETFKSK